MSAVPQMLHELLQKHGHSTFRPGQLETIRAVMAGRPTLSVMPTGAGKSLCYMLPAELVPGATVVVSPLVSLMQDQLRRLHEAGIPAEAIHSGLSDPVRAAAEERVARGEARVVLVSPERFRAPSFRKLLDALTIGLFVVDEAHCVSEWGHAFRPDYELLGAVLARLRPPRILAMTATASPDVRQDIVRALGFADPVVVVTGFDRPNIHLEVQALTTEAEKRDTMLRAIEPGVPAIVYAATRGNTDKYARHLLQQGRRARAYHGGLAPDDRAATQRAFLAGELDVVVATNAFGLGIDKSDVRLVVHADLPRSLEAYYQELGRAGRDGSPAAALLLFAQRDIFVQKRLIELGCPEAATVRRVFGLMRGAPAGLTAEALAGPGAQAAVRIRVQSALAFLEGRGLAVRSFGAGAPRIRIGSGFASGDGFAAALSRALGHPKGEVECDEAAMAARLAMSRDEFASLLEQAVAAKHVRRRGGGSRPRHVLADGAVLDDDTLRRLRVRELRERRRLEEMIRLGNATTCRRKALLSALGERSVPERCAGCDRCVGPRFHGVRARLPALLEAVRSGSRRGPPAWTDPYPAAMDATLALAPPGVGGDPLERSR